MINKKIVNITVIAVIASIILVSLGILSFFEDESLTKKIEIANNIDNRISPFTNQGLTIKLKSGEFTFISWKEMSSLTIEGENQGYMKKMRIIIRVHRDVITIPIRGYYEFSTKSRSGKLILNAVKEYYERMK